MKLTFNRAFEYLSYCYNWQFPIIMLLITSWGNSTKKQMDAHKILFKMNTYVLPIQFFFTVINTIIYTKLFL